MIPRIYIRPAVVGLLGGLLGYLLGELLPNNASRSALSVVFSTGIWSGLIGLGLGCVLLINENLQGLRGRWSRDLAMGALLFAGFGLVAGALAEWFYQSGSQNSFTRAIGWAMLGLGLGLVLGVLRHDAVQALRGMLGGAAGGFVGGLLFNTVFLLNPSGNGQTSRAIGLAIMGLAISLLIRFVQEALKGAWLMGITTGPFEGKQFILSKSRVTVGRSDANDIGLYQEKDLPFNCGAFVVKNNTWHYEGETVLVNGQPTNNASLVSGSVIRFGGTDFVFQLRGAENNL